MESKWKRIVLLLVGVALGVCIIFAPTIITGQGYSERDLGEFLVGNLIVRSSALMLGLLVIYDAVKTCFKE